MKGTWFSCSCPILIRITDMGVVSQGEDGLMLSLLGSVPIYCPCGRKGQVINGFKSAYYIGGKDAVFAVVHPDLRETHLCSGRPAKVNVFQKWITKEDVQELKTQSEQFNQRRDTPE